MLLTAARLIANLGTEQRARERPRHRTKDFACCRRGHRAAHEQAQQREWEKQSPERDKMREIFDIEIMEGTVNFGLPLVGAGIVANSNGAVCGRQSTGVELGRMEEALKLF